MKRGNWKLIYCYGNHVWTIVMFSLVDWVSLQSLRQFAPISAWLCKDMHDYNTMSNLCRRVSNYINNSRRDDKWKSKSCKRLKAIHQLTLFSAEKQQMLTRIKARFTGDFICSRCSFVTNINPLFKLIYLHVVRRTKS